ncbi:MAG: hypothetical protein R6W72_10375 [Desulfurivibrionaceae bacterium]
MNALGAPHPEIHRLLVNDEERDFTYPLGPNDRIEVFGLTRPTDPTEATFLQSGPPRIRFAVDVMIALG